MSRVNGSEPVLNELVKSAKPGKVGNVMADKGEENRAGKNKANKDSQREISVAVAGNPNSGKSTLINAIAGTKLHVGNWSGVTVEKKEALIEYLGNKIRLVDLPGTYSLSPYSQEEVIARDYLVDERPDLIIDVVDSTNLERNLYLTVQLLELGIPVVMALNIYDEAEKKGYKIDVKPLEEMLGIKAVTTSAIKKKGLDELLTTVVEVSKGRPGYSHKYLNYGEDVENSVKSIEKQLVEDYPDLAEDGLLRWVSMKLIEGDEYVQSRMDGVDIAGLVDKSAGILKSTYNEDIESIMADARYAQAAGITREVFRKPELSKMELTEKIDRVVLSRYFGIPVFLAAMWLLFKLTFDISTPFVDWVDGTMAGPIMRWAEVILTSIGASDWMISLATEGVIGGVGTVFVFVPVIFAMMFFITLLEASGYMARAAFVMDRAMHAIGLHGKSFIPMLLGFGCNVPGIYATRTLENQKDRILTALLVPLMSCGARLPVYVLFTAAFFSANKGTVLWLLYMLGIVMAVFMGLIFKKTLFKGEAPMFVMELPPYRLPSFRNLLAHTWEKGKHFLIKAGTYILAVSVMIWFLLNLPWGVENKKDSYLGKVSQAAAPVFKPLGFGNWQATSSLLTGVIAKEIVVSTMSQTYGIEEKQEQPAEKTPSFGEDIKGIGTSFVVAVKDAAVSVASGIGISSISAEEEEEQTGLKSEIKKDFTPLSAFAFMTFVLLYVPCIIVLVAMREEFLTWKWAGFTLAYQFVLAWVVAFVIYQGGKMLGVGV